MNVHSAHSNRQAIEKQSSFPERAYPAATTLAHLAQLTENKPEKQRRGAGGTVHAIKNRISSEASDSAQTWGGRRNSVARTSDCLSRKQVTQIIEAAQFAAAIGLPFNRFLTIHWQQAGIPDSEAAKSTGRYLKLAGDWIAKRGGRIAWAWVRENGDGKGSHVHILLHLPADKITGNNGRGLANMPRRWLRSITGKPYRAGTIKTERIGGTAGAAQSAPVAYWANLAAVVGYIVKGASPAAARALGMVRLEADGTIIGKRAATSQNIGRAARVRAIK